MSNAPKLDLHRPSMRPSVLHGWFWYVSKESKGKNVCPVLSNYLYGVSKEKRPTVGARLMVLFPGKKRILDALASAVLTYPPFMEKSVIAPGTPQSQLTFRKTKIAVGICWVLSMHPNKSSLNSSNHLDWFSWSTRRHLQWLPNGAHPIPCPYETALENHGGWEFRWIS